MNAAQINAIREADNYLRCAGLPTYSEVTTRADHFPGIGNMVLATAQRQQRPAERPEGQLIGDASDGCGEPPGGQSGYGEQDDDDDNDDASKDH